MKLSEGIPIRETPSVDLHGLRPEQALRRVAQELHAVRVRGGQSLLIITGRGWGNLEQKPVLLPKVRAWLLGPEGQRLGVKRVESTAKDGALEAFF